MATETAVSLKSLWSAEVMVQQVTCLSCLQPLGSIPGTPYGPLSRPEWAKLLPRSHQHREGLW